MAHSFNPHPVIGTVKILLLVLILASALFLLRDRLGGLFQTLLLAVLALGAASMALAFIMAKFQSITLDESSILYASGILSMKKTVVPYSKVTEASYVQGLIQRIFGVGTLSVDSAGGSAVAIRMENVRYSDLKKIIEEINAKSGKGGGA